MCRLRDHVGGTPVYPRKPLTCCSALAQQEREEIAIIRPACRRKCRRNEVKAAIAEDIKGTDAAGVKDMGRIIGALRGKSAGKLDFAKSSAS